METVTATASTVPACLDALKALLEAEPTLASCKVFTAGADPSDMGTSSVVFHEPVEVECEYTIGTPMQLVSEEYDLGGVLEAVKAGGGEDTVKAARDAAYAVYASVCTVLSENDTVSGVVTDARITSHKMEQGAYEGEGRACRISFTVHCRAKFQPA